MLSAGRSVRRRLVAAAPAAVPTTVGMGLPASATPLAGPAAPEVCAVALLVEGLSPGEHTVTVTVTSLATGDPVPVLLPARPATGPADPDDAEPGDTAEPADTPSDPGTVAPDDAPPVGGFTVTADETGPRPSPLGVLLPTLASGSVDSEPPVLAAPELVTSVTADPVADLAPAAFALSALLGGTLMSRRRRAV